MSAKLKKIVLLYSFLPVLLLPHLPQLHPPLTSLPVAVLLRSLLSSSSSFFLCRLSCSFILTPPPSPGSVKGCLRDGVSRGQIPHRARARPPPFAQRRPRRGFRLQIGVTGQQQSRQRQLFLQEEGPVDKQAAIRQPYGSPSGSWSGSCFTPVWVLIQH